MKSDKLIDAIGLIDEKLIERSQKSSQKSQKREKIKRFIKWTVPVAAIVALTIGVGSLFGNTPIELSAYALAEAKYPETANTLPTIQPKADLRSSKSGMMNSKNGKRSF